MDKKSRTGRKRVDRPKRLGGSSISRTKGKNVPSSAFAPTDIPKTEIGIFDTTRWKLDIGPLVDEGCATNATHCDVNRLLREGWRKLTIAIENRAGEVTRLVRHIDGARISIYRRSITFEVSAPRLAGRLNSDQYRLGEFASVLPLREFERLIPLTTFLARRRHGRTPFLARLDLAVNFRAAIPTLVEAYRTARHPKVRKKADAYGSTGLGFYGTRFDLILYSLEHKPRRSKLVKLLAGKHTEPLPGIVRLELRYKTPASITAALREMVREAREIPDSAAAVPCLSVSADGRKRIELIPFVNHELHRQVMREVLRLAGGRSIKSPKSEGNLLRRIAIKALAEQPELMPEVEANYCGKTVAKIRRQVSALHLQDAETALVRLAWPMAQPRTVGRRRGCLRVSHVLPKRQTCAPMDTMSVGGTAHATTEADEVSQAPPP